LYDMYGNSSPAETVSGVATLRAGLDPVYLEWTSPGSCDEVQVSPPILAMDTTQSVLLGATTRLSMTVRNPGDEPMQAQLQTRAQARVPLAITPPTQKISLSPGEPVKLGLSLQAGLGDRPLELPLWWKVFVDVDYTQLSPEQFQSVPDQLPGKKGMVQGQYVWAENNHIDVSKISGGVHDRRPGMVYAVLDSPEDISLDCGASADWYMAWYLNGQKVFDDIQKGNLESGLAAHSFTLPLKKGRNVIAVALLSGTFGWVLDFGGPKELEISRTGGTSPDNLTVTLVSGGKTLTTQNVPLQLQTPVPALGSITSSDQLDQWMTLQPFAVLNEEAVKNYWMKEPDASRWYKGKDDLSGIVWLRNGGANLEVFAAIKDDVLVQAPSASELSKYDSLRLVLAGDEGNVLLDVTGGLVNGAAALVGANAPVVFRAARQESAPSATTCYHFTVPRRLIGDAPFRISLAVADNDSNYLKQTLQLGNVDVPAEGMREVLAPSSSAPNSQIKAVKSDAAEEARK
ncbi:MAG TPA: hypothetical protein VIM71_08685, partial [Lacunisphaera sp.]